MQSSARVVIVGGGIMGASLLYHLAELGWTDTLLIEKDELTSGSTWHAAGQCPNITGSYNLAKMHAYSNQLYPKLEAITGQYVSWHASGGIRLATNDRELAWLKYILGYSKAIGFGMQPLARALNAQIHHGARVALIGPNGAGKTTLARTIAGRLAPLNGRARLGANVRVGYMAQEQELLDPALDALATVRGLASMSETDARAFLHYFLFAGDDVFVPVGALSFGERARLSLASLVVQGCNFLVLDEPINHLDIPSRARFEQALSAYDGTVLAIVHDRFFIAGFASEKWKLADGRLEIERW